MDNRLHVEKLVARARVAQKKFEGFDQRQVDAVVRAIARVVFEQAAPLAWMAVDETRMGVYEDKVKKNQGKAKIIWHHLKGKPSVGILRRDAGTGVIEIAKPMGVVGAVTPCTNPIVTPMCNAMFALKCRNAIILAPHPRARRCAEHVAELFRAAIEALGAPADLIQVLREPSVELTGELMKAVDVIIATGGMGMVRAAYGSGKPAYGVGTGNVQCILDKGYDPRVAVPKIVAGRVFDNGIICSGEQTLFIHRDDFQAVVAVLEAEGAVLVENAEDKDLLRRTLFDNGAANKDATGQSALRIAELCGFEVPAGTRLLVCEADGPGAADILCREKMCPVLTLMRYDTFEQAMDLALEGLETDGKGHSISIHSDDEARIEYAAGRAPVSRVLVNQICATMNGGSFFNGFTPTTTLGCGSWGGNSISENLDYRHLMNITRIGHYMKDAVVPTDDALWGVARVDLMEYKVKEVFARFAVPTVPGFVVRSPDELPEDGPGLVYPLVCKAQVPVGGRGKAGGIRFAGNRAELVAACRGILGMDIKGHTVERLLVVGKVELVREMYLSILLDRATKGPLVIFSARGGMDIEEVARTEPDQVLKVAIDPGIGIRDYVPRYLLSRAGLPDALAVPLGALLSDLYRMFTACDATLVEINPLALANDGRLVALDGKMSVDDSSLYRQADLLAYRDEQTEDGLVLAARRAGFLYIPCDPDGDIAVMSNGSGMIMSSMDRIGARGMKVRTAFDLGGGATADRIRQAIAIVLSDPSTRALFLNIFGGITRCDEVAAGVTAAAEGLGPDRLLVVRFEGTNKEKGLAALAAAKGGVAPVENLQEAVAALEAWKGKR